MTKWRDKYKQTFSAYGIKRNEKTSRTSEKKEKALDIYARMYECGKHFINSTYERVCAAQETTISMMKYIVKNIYLK